MYRVRNGRKLGTAAVRCCLTSKNHISRPSLSTFPSTFVRVASGRRLRVSSICRTATSRDARFAHRVALRPVCRYRPCTTAALHRPYARPAVTTCEDLRSPSLNKQITISTLRRLLSSNIDTAQLVERGFEHDASTQRLLHHSGNHLNISSITS